MAVDPDLIQWARREAAELRSKAVSEDVQQRMSSPAQARGLGSAALEFLRIHAGNTAFQVAAEQAFTLNLRNAGAGLSGAAEALDAWAQYAEDGLIDAISDDAQARAVASTDLMEQVQQLLADKTVHPAAPVVLAGAALEEFLRARVIAGALPVVGKPGISSYAAAMRAAGALSAQDVKDITAWAGQRNEAAHGEFEHLSRQRAQIMIDGVNLFFRTHLI